MKIGVITLGFEAENPGGVANVVIKVLDFIVREKSYTVELFSFSNKIYDPNSFAILHPRKKRRKLVESGFFFGEVPLTRIGAIGSELEFLRYRKRNELVYLFEKFDLLIVVTGALQFANVLPKLQIPVLIQCATRLNWERKSQYKSMVTLKKLALKMQMPILAIQEFKVLRSNVLFLVENSKMQDWISMRSKFYPKMWYPGIETTSSLSYLGKGPQKEGHFISVGRFNEPRKGWDRLFLAYKAAYDRMGNLPPLIVIGWGSFSKEVQAIIDELIPRYPIKVLPNLSNQERDSQIQSASYFLQTSHEEGLGLAALEALGFGVPLICSETDGSREYVIEGVSGALVTQGKYFTVEFANVIIQSQNWDYAALSFRSKKLFDKQFNSDVSQKKLIEIIKTSITGKE